MRAEEPSSSKPPSCKAPPSSPPSSPAFSTQSHSPCPPPPIRESPQACKKCFCFSYPYNAPVRRSSATTIERIRVRSPCGLSHIRPVAVAIGPYHHASPHVQEMGQAKRAALDEFCRVTSQPRVVVQEKIASVAKSAHGCYAKDSTLRYLPHNQFVDMMMLDGCFLLQFMVSMCPDDPNAPPEEDPLMSRAEVHSRMDSIARDVLLLENQIPWLVLEALMELRPAVPVDKFLALVASAFDVGHSPTPQAQAQAQAQLGGAETNYRDQPPMHLLGLFHRRQVGVARTQSLSVPRLHSLSTTAVELAEMGVKLTASKTKKFGDMAMSKRRRPLGLFGELSLAPLVLNDLTMCWLINMAAYEACLGAALADNFAISSYLSLIALLMNREEDVQQLRAKGIVNSAFSDIWMIAYFKCAVSDLRVGHRYYHVFQSLQEYKQERWVWIAIHSFFYTNLKAIVAVLSIIGVLAGLFKTILSLKQPQR
ncbi:unnamed protein product [Urochloa humidicola]